VANTGKVGAGDCTGPHCHCGQSRKSPIGGAGRRGPDLPTQQAIEKETSFTEAQRTAVGIGSGVMVGAGAGLVIEAWRQVQPTSGAILTIGSALIAAGLGGWFGASIIDEFQWDAKNGNLTIRRRHRGA
jgi:hypothetical protein